MPSRGYCCSAARLRRCGQHPGGSIWRTVPCCSRAWRSDRFPSADRSCGGCTTRHMRSYCRRPDRCVYSRRPESPATRYQRNLRRCSGNRPLSSRFPCRCFQAPESPSGCAVCRRNACRRDRHSSLHSHCRELHYISVSHTESSPRTSALYPSPASPHRRNLRGRPQHLLRSSMSSLARNPAHSAWKRHRDPRPDLSYI